MSTTTEKPFEDEVLPAPVASRPPSEKSRTWRQWAANETPKRMLLIVLLLQAGSAGLLDATTYGDFSTFASNQTGNLILLTLAAVGTVQILLVLTAVSFGGFVVAAFIMGHLANHFGPRRRAWLLTTLGLQLCALVTSAVLLSPCGPPAVRHGGKDEWAVLLLFSTMSGAQVAMARQSQCQEVPTAPMTSPIVDLIIDPHVFRPFGHGSSGPRNRRLAYFLVLITGSFVGAALHRFVANWSVVVVAIGMKCLAISIVMFMHAE